MVGNSFIRNSTVLKIVNVKKQSGSRMILNILFQKQDPIFMMII